MRSRTVASALDTCRWLCQLLAVFALISCGGSGGDEASAPSSTSPTLFASAVANVSHYEVVFDGSRSQQYAAAFSSTSSATTLFVIDVQTGASRELPARTRHGGPPHNYYWPGLISLSSSGRFLYFINDSYQLARFDLNNEVVDFVVPSPSSWGPNVRIERIVASPIDDMTVYAELSGISSGVVSLAAVTNQSWLPRRLDVAAAFSATAPAVNSQASELFVALSDGRFRRVRVLSDGIGEVIAEVPSAPSPFSSRAKPEYLADGILLDAKIYDSETLAERLTIPSASRCTAVGNGTRLACYGPPPQGLHSLFVYDRVTGQRTAEWSAGFLTGTVFVAYAPGAITAAGAGKVAVSYGVVGRGATNFPVSIAIYSDPAFN